MNQTTAAAIKSLDLLIEQADPEGNKIEILSVVGAVYGLADVQELCHFLAAHSGWWTDLKTGLPFTLEQVNIPEKLMLIVSEVAEAMEGARKDLMDDKLPHRKMLEVELADALIRIFDLAGFLKLDLAGATVEKLAFNQQRADHKVENRTAEGGKKF
jgi:NTP pyrophosphatase (non-canonical NTP hydrolase)